MFESALIESQGRPRPKKRLLFIPVAIIVHLLVGGSMLLAQYWTLSPVDEPVLQVTFFSAAAPPPPPPPPPPPAAPKPPEAPKPVVQAAPTTPVQPVDIPEDVPEPSTAPDTGGVEGISGGVEGGVEGGVPGGVPGGVVDSAGTGDEILRVGGAITAPVATNRVPPVYTEAARRARIQGVVVVEAIIDKDGNVTQVRVLKGLPMGLDRSAQEAVQRWKFKPAALNGRPVSVYFTLTVNFRLQ
jgi:protein TonB